MPKGNETTTKFKVDISDLKKAMQTARKEVALANSEFKAASSGMDDWSKSSDGISAKLKQLNSNLSSQKTVLAEYEKTLAEVKAQYGENSSQAMEYLTKLNNQKAVVNKTESEIRKYSDALNNLGNELEDAGDSADSASGGFTVLKGALADLVADGIRAASEALRDLMTDSAEAYAQFSAATGVAADAMGEYEEAIKNVYKNNFGESLEDVATKMARVKEVTGELDASKLQDMTEKAITLDDVFGMDMTETLRGVQSLMTHFGMTSEEAFDYLASGAQNGLNYTDELGDNISEYAGKFAEAGYTADEYFQLLQNGSDGGAYNLDKVNDAINEVTARLADGTIGDSLDMFSSGTQDIFKAWQNGEATQKQVIDSIVKDIQGTTNEQEKMNLAAKAFGTMAEDGGTMFIQSLTSVGDTYDDVTGKAEELASIKYDTPAAALSGLGRTIKTELLQPIVDKLVPVVTDFLNWCNEHINIVIPIVAALAAAFGVLATALAIQGLISGVSKAMAFLNATMLANPIVLIVAAIAALVTAFVLLWKKSEAFRNFWITLWDKLSTTVKKVADKIKSVFNSVWTSIKSVWSGVTGFFNGIWNGILSTVTNVWGKIKTTITGVFTGIKSAWSGLTSFTSGVISGIKGAFDSLVSGVKSAVNKVISGINSAIGIINKIPSVNISKIPQLATGGVLKRGQVGLLEGNGAEAVVPLERNKYWIKKVADDLKDQLYSSGNGLLTGNSLSASGGRVVNSYTQNIYSPKQLSRLEIYRQSKNLLGYAGGGY